MSEYDRHPGTTAIIAAIEATEEKWSGAPEEPVIRALCENIRRSMLAVDEHRGLELHPMVFAAVSHFLIDCNDFAQVLDSLGDLRRGN